jgi:transcription elongation GreA/GreB family factor
MDERAAIRFINSIPEGFWTAYSDVAAVCGSSSPRSIGVWLRRSSGRINNYWRVLNVDGEVPDEFVGGGSGPVTPENARDKLRREGVWIDAGGRARQRQRFTPLDYAAFLRDGTIRAVEKARPSIVVQDPAVQPRPGELRVGGTVRIREEPSGEETTRTIVNAGKRAGRENELSAASPVGRALLGRVVGDLVDADTPKGKRRFLIVEVSS